MKDPLIPVYFMPGMAASSDIFEHISLPESRFEMIRLDWFNPSKGMSLKDYAQEMITYIKHPNPVLVGVSFGGVLVQEIAQQIPTHKVIIISSVKQKKEMPRRLIFAKYTKAHKLLPTGIVNNIELLAKYAFGETVSKRLDLYERYLSIRDKTYLDWAIDQMVRWNQREYEPGIIHIHGDKDAVFPFQYINDCIPVENGTHTMIIHRYKWFNEHLPTIILE
ncbi:MAG: alpha/beta hydrolase [Bacteroidia bacterium]|nr:alpha/beta hydrolase [Bacteroidia bacterium]